MQTNRTEKKAIILLAVARSGQFHYSQVGVGWGGGVRQRAEILLLMSHRITHANANANPSA